MKRLVYLLLISAISFAPSLVKACTIVMVAKDGVVLAGNNEDFVLPLTKVWITPPSKGRYGRICFGFEDGLSEFHGKGNSAQGGMNDQGLFLDANSVRKQGWQAEPGKPYASFDTLDRVLAECATVQEAIDFFKRHNFPGLDRARIPIADRTGDSVVIEWAHKKVQFVKKKGNYQIATNFVISNYPSGKYPCWRYKNADRILSREEKYSVDFIRSVLNAVHVRGRAVSTLYSNIYDLKKGIVYIYNFHNFDEVVALNLSDELKKGARSYPLYKLFKKHSETYRKFLKDAPVNSIRHAYYNMSPMLGSFFYNAMKKYYPEFFGIQFDETVLERLGNSFMKDKKIDVAITFFEKNTKEYPKSPKVYLNLAAAYEQKGDKTRAINYYRKILELKLENLDAKNALKRLKEN